MRKKIDVMFAHLRITQILLPFTESQSAIWFITEYSIACVLRLLYASMTLAQLIYKLRTPKPNNVDDKHGSNSLLVLTKSNEYYASD